MADQKFPNNIGNNQGNSLETALPCPQISSTVYSYLVLGKRKGGSSLHCKCIIESLLWSILCKTQDFARLFLYFLSIMGARVLQMYWVLFYKMLAGWTKSLNWLTNKKYFPSNYELLKYLSLTNRKSSHFLLVRAK